jgi:hypothetical protein
MEIQFKWATPTTQVDRDVFQSNFRDELNEDSDVDPHLLPCHPGVVTAHVLSIDPLEVFIEGKLVCSCGKSYLSFACGSDASNLRYV